MKRLYKIVMTTNAMWKHILSPLQYVSMLPAYSVVGDNLSQSLKHILSPHQPGKKYRYRHILLPAIIYALGRQYVPRVPACIVAGDNMCRGDNICRHKTPLLNSHEYRVWRHILSPLHILSPATIYAGTFGTNLSVSETVHFFIVRRTQQQQRKAAL